MAIITADETATGNINAGERKRASLCANGAAAVPARSGKEEEDGRAPGGGVHVFVKKEATTAVIGERGGERELVRADAVIITVPLSVLQAGAVEFDPPLPEVHFAVPCCCCSTPYYLLHNRREIMISVATCKPALCLRPKSED